MASIKLTIEYDGQRTDEAHIFVDGHIDERTYRFLLDTGAGSSSIISDDFTAQFKAEGTSDGQGVFKPNADDLIMIPQLRVGSVITENLIISRMDALAENRFSLLGMDVWKHVCCAYYFAEKNLIVNPTPNEASCSNLRPLQLGAKFHPYIPVEFANITASTVWDTGASLTVVDSNFVDKYPHLFTADGFDEGIDSSGEVLQTPMYQMQACQIGGLDFSAVRVAAVDLAPINASIELRMDMILGYNILSQTNWLFDFPNKQWGFID